MTALPPLPVITGLAAMTGLFLGYAAADWPPSASGPHRLPVEPLLAGLALSLTGVKLYWDMARRLTTLRAERDRYQATLESVTDGIWETNAEGRLTHVSPALMTRLGLPAERLEDGLDMLVPACREGQHALYRIRTMMALWRPFRDIRLRLQSATGDVRFLQLSGRPRLTASGELAGYIGTMSDITAQGLAAERARLAETRLAAAISSMAEGFALFDVHDRLELRNWRFDALLKQGGPKPPEGSRLKQILLDAAADPAPVEAFFAARFANQADPLRLRTKDGRWLQVRLAPTRDNGTQTLWTDITRTVRQEEEDEQKSLEQHHAQRLEAIGTLAGGIAHEINTPIQYIGDNLTFLSSAFDDLQQYLDATGQPVEGSPLRTLWHDLDMDFLKAEIPQALAQSQEGIEHVTNLVRSMKEFAHPSARAPIAVDMAHAVETTLAVSRNEWKHTAEVSVEIAEDLAPALAVPGEINQVLLNLVVNAAHAVQDAGHSAGSASGLGHEHGDGRIGIALRNAGTPEAPMIEVEVRDNGIGMSPDIAARIFEPFFTTKAIGRGSGQGLAIVHDIVVRKHGGTLTVDSMPGVGTSVFLRLPAAPETAPVCGTAPAC